MTQPLARGPAPTSPASGAQIRLHCAALSARRGRRRHHAGLRVRRGLRRLHHAVSIRSATNAALSLAQPGGAHLARRRLHGPRHLQPHRLRRAHLARGRRSARRASAARHRRRARPGLAAISAAGSIWSLQRLARRHAGAAAAGDGDRHGGGARAVAATTPSSPSPSRWCPIVARVIRSNTLSLREQPFVEAARAVGMSELRIAVRHVLPNTLAPLIVLATAQLGSAILTEASLSFLGLGVPEPHPSWGRMLSESAAEYVRTAPWLVIFPGVAISLAVFGTNLLGDALRDMLDPRQRNCMTTTANCVGRPCSETPRRCSGRRLRLLHRARASSRRSTACQLRGRGRRDAGDRRRIGLRQDHDRAVADAPGAGAARPHRRRARSSSPARDLLTLSEAAMRDVRGNDIAMIFQEPMTSLNPVLTIGNQIAEMLLLHERSGRRQARDEGASRCCDLVRIPEPAQRAQRISAPALGRHAPARDDRHGAGLQSQGADRRRADHRARRHHPGADPRPDPRPAARARHRGDPDHPRPRRRRRDRAARHRDVCRPQGRGGRRSTNCSRGRCIPTRTGLLASIPRLDDARRGPRPRPSGCRKSPAWCRR